MATPLPAMLHRLLRAIAPAPLTLGMIALLESPTYPQPPGEIPSRMAIASPAPLRRSPGKANTANKANVEDHFKTDDVGVEVDSESTLVTDTAGALGTAEGGTERIEPEWNTASAHPVAPFIRFDEVLDDARESIGEFGSGLRTRAEQALDDVGEMVTEGRQALAEVVKEKPAQIRQFLHDRLSSISLAELVGRLEQLRAAEYGDHWGETYKVPGVRSSLESTQTVLQAIAQNPGKTGAVIYTFARGQDLELTLVLPDGPPKRHTLKGRVSTLQNATHTLRLGITDPLQSADDAYLEPGQELYRALVAPFRKTLDKAGVDILMFSLDSGLRSLPVAALHDGEEFLIENYAVAIIPSFGLLNAQYQPLTNAKVLVAGASRFERFNDLPAVPVELAAIQENWSTVNLLENKFTLDAIQKVRKREKFAIVHLATHAVFQQGEPNQSFVQLWGNERLTFDAIASLNFHRPPLELLVLSACQTAFGDDAAELGFAGLSVQSGAKSVVASLWRVSDTGTLALMSEFYDHLGDLPTKAEALRQAQLAMLQNKTITAKEFWASNHRGGFSDARPVDFNSNRSLSHPYYWAGFTLVGSPW